MTDKFTAAQWAEIEGGHEVTPVQEESYSFLRDLHESRMTKDNGNAKKLTYTDCGERIYLTLLALETMRQYPDFKAYVQRYAKKTAGFEQYKMYRIMGTDLYNFTYFLVGDSGAQDKLKDPESAKRMRASTKLPTSAINRYINTIAQGKTPVQVNNLFQAIESAIKVTNSDYKSIRRNLMNFARLTKAEKRLISTRLIFAVRAKLRSSDIIEDFEKFASIKNLEKASVIDPEPTISTPDLSTTGAELALYRYLVGDRNLALTKKFLEQAKDGKAASANMVAAYLPAIKMIDDIVKAGPGAVQQLRAVHNRAKRS
tara:strand:- start:1018 stop:1959 length:942 start_codon:yes stop_codon:yes gene_type:complete